MAAGRDFGADASKKFDPAKVFSNKSIDWNGMLMSMFGSHDTLASFAAAMGDAATCGPDMPPAGGFFRADGTINRGRFTDRARKALTVARKQAHELGSPVVAAGHLLLGILADEHGIGGTVLREFKLDFRSVRDYLVAAKHGVPGVYEVPSGRSKGVIVQPPAASQLPEAVSLQEVLIGAVRRAEALGHNYVGSEHLTTTLFGGVSPVVATICDIYGISAHQVVERALFFCTPAVLPVVEKRASCTPHLQILRISLTELRASMVDVPGAVDELDVMVKALDSLEGKLQVGDVVGGSVPPDVVDEIPVEVGDKTLVYADTLLYAVLASRRQPEALIRFRHTGQWASRSANEMVVYGWEYTLRERLRDIRASAAREGWGWEV